MFNQVLENTLRSSAFLSVFVGFYQWLGCTTRRAILSQTFPIKRDHHLFWAVLGGVAGLTVMIEKAGRRSELAIYVSLLLNTISISRHWRKVVPRAMDIAYRIFIDSEFKCAELLFAVSMAGIMPLYEFDRKHLSSVVSRVGDAFLARK